MDLAHLADGARPHVLDGGSRIVPRVALVAHLRRDACALRFASELPRFGDGPRQRLLHVHVFAEIHRRQCDQCVHVVGRGDDDRVDVLLLVEHLAVVLIARGARQMVGLQPLHPLDLPGHALSLDGGQRRLRPALRVATRPIRRPIQPRLLVRYVAVERGKPFVRVLPVDVAERNDVLGGEVDEVRAALTAHADRGDVQRVARRRHAAAEDVPWNDRQTGAGDRHVGHETATGHVAFRH